MSQFYICYETNDYENADIMISKLKDLGHSVSYISYDNQDVLIDYAKEMMEKIQKCDKFVCLYNEDSIQSRLTDVQIHYAFSLNKNIYLAKETKENVSSSLQFLIGAKAFYGKDINALNLKLAEVLDNE